MAARTRKIHHDAATRDKIQAAQLINRLHKCVMGEVDLTSAQVSAAKTLLGKVLPDLQAGQHYHEHDVADPLKSLLSEIATQKRRVTD